MGKKTISEYDKAGRRISVTHPASGKTTFGYDGGGNLITKQTENLRKQGIHTNIRYTYTFNRLDSIIYPNHPENNVRYQYGAPGAAFNRVGRLEAIEDGSGRQEFKYGRQGELTGLSRTLVIPNQGVANYVTQWEYDSWNRLKNMTYPDGEVVTYSYNQGGLLNKVTGTKSGTTTVYVDDIRYDKFEQRTLLKYDNGTQTDYTYDPLNRLMNTLKVQKGSTVLMNNTYTYDAVQNITGIVSSDITQGAIGGSMSHQYRYDNLNRLDSAWGSFVGPNSKKADYTLGLSYDNLHNITRKTQDIVQQNLKFSGILSAGYNLSYSYANNSQQIANIADASYRADRSGGAYSTGRQQTDVLNEKAQSFTYDANGNMTYVATGKKLNDSTLQATSTRKLLWDEENRLLAISDNGYVSNYWYDAAGERTVKQSGGSEGVFVNGVLSGARTETGKFTAYISPYMVVSNGGNYSKHIYMGSQRIVSKLSNSGIFAASPVTATQQQARYALQTSKIKERFDSLGVVYKGLTQTGGLISINPASTASEYFYHSDHLGSSSLITDGTGALVQHIEYVPFGETFIDERNGSWSTPYLFNGKEKDEETGLHYYGARYYDSRLGVWLSVDPLAEKKPWMTSYHYCSNNPMNRIDPDGRDDIFSSSGRFLYKTPEGNNIRIQKGKSLLLPSQTGNSLSNRALMRIVFHYVDQKGYIGTFGVDGSENDNRLGYIEPANGTVRILRNQFLSGAFDNYNNLVSVLEHEGDPGFGHKSELEKLNSKFYQFFDHAFVYYSQASSETFKNTTDEFKLGVAYSFAVRLSNALSNKEISNIEYQKFIDMFNEATGISIYVNIKFGKISITYDNKQYPYANIRLINPRE